MSKRQPKYNRYFIILVLGFLIWIAETAYFGFNKEPENGLEGFLDVSTALMMIYGFIGDMLHNVRIHKHYHNVTSNRITTKRVEVTGDHQKINYNIGVKAADQLKGKPNS
jgi:hypothetical protein